MVRNLFSHGLRNTTDILFRRQASITSAAAIIISLSLASRVLGLIRQRILLGQFGSNSDELAAFFAAFKIPDIIFNILVLGALATAFIPVISSYLAKREDHEAWKVFSVVVNYSMVFVAIFSVLVFIFADFLSAKLLLGYSSKPEILQLTANIIRVLVIGQFFLIVSNFVTGVLNSYHRFLIPALSPVIYNLGIIAGTVFLSGSLGIFGPVFGVVLGAFGHLAIQLPLMAKLGVRYSTSFDASIPGVKEVGRLMAPRAFGLAVGQIDSLADTVLASVITSAATATNIIVLNAAFILQAVPAGVFGYALGVASLPTLAKEFAQENLENFKATLIASLHQILYLVIPSVVILVVLRIPVVRLIYGAPEFDWDATKLTAFTLAAFSIGIIAQSAIQLLARGFYALHDTKTPVKISLITVAVNVIASVFFVYKFNNIIWLGISATVAGSVNALLLLYFLSRRVGGLNWVEVTVAPAKMALAGLLSGIALYTPLKVLDSASYGQLWLQGSIVHTFFGPLAVDTSHTPGLLAVTIVSATLGLIVYFLMTYLLGVEEISVFAKIFAKLRRLPVIRRLEEAAVAEPVSGNGQ